MSLTLTLTIGCIIGAIIHLLVKINSINKKLCTTSYKEVFKEYWKRDWSTFLVAIGGIIGIVFVGMEWLKVEDTDKVPASLYEILQYKIVQFGIVTGKQIGRAHV